MASLTALQVGAVVVESDRPDASWTMPAWVTLAARTERSPSGVIFSPPPTCTRPGFALVASPGLALVMSWLMACQS